MNSPDQTIIACSSGANQNSAIALIRLSGFSDISEFQEFFSVNLKQVKPRYSTLTELTYEGQLIDSVLLNFFPGPNSFTGENLLELSVHGNKINIDRIINLFISLDLVRVANPGEFTFRALQNKKLSLSQVEGLDLLLNAQTTMALTEGQKALHGQLDNVYSDLYKSFLKIRSSIELSIDFLDDVGEENSKTYLDESIQDFRGKINSLEKRTRQFSGSLLTPSVVLLGPPNAGKSTFFNKFLEFNRSIVSEVPGTTRDYISEGFIEGGNHFQLIDTAGLRDTNDNIEKEGISRVTRLLEEAFFKVLIINPFDFDLNDFKEFLNIKPELIFFSHSDIPEFKKAQKRVVESLEGFYQKGLQLIPGPIEPVVFGPIEPDAKKSGPIEPDAEKSGPIEPVELIRRIIHNKYKYLSDKEPILIERHRDLIKNVHSSFNSFCAMQKSEDDIAIISSELNIIGNDIDQLIGITTADDVLGNIFSNFCIGK